MLKEIINNFKGMPVNKKIAFILLTILILLLFYLCIVFFIGKYLLMPIMGEGLYSNALLYGIKTSAGKLISGAFFAMFLIAVIINISKRPKRNEIVDTDERGVSQMKNKTHGSARLMTKKEAEKEFIVGNIEDTTSDVFGSLDPEPDKYTGRSGTKKSTVSRKARGDDEQNMIVYGSPGTGKSIAVVRTNALQARLRGDSFICTDPAKELYTDLSEEFRRAGYIVYVLNLKDPEHSHFWNCLEETIDPETGRLDGTRLNTFAQVYMNNSKNPGEKEDKFWFDSALNILKATIGYCSFERESWILDEYKELYKKVGRSLPDYETNLVLFNGNASFVWCKKIIKDAANTSKYNIYDVDDILEKIELRAPEYTMGRVFDLLMSFTTPANGETLSTEEKIQSPAFPITHPGKIAYTIYSTNKGSAAVAAGAIQGALMKMMIFSDDKTKGLLSHSEIHLSDTNKRKTAIFLITPEGSNPNRAIASLFFTFLFKDVQDNYDKAVAVSKVDHSPITCTDTTVILDEFSSLGVIGADIAEFANVMSICRKRHVHITIIVQNYTQMEEIYNHENAMTIQNNSSAVMFLGTNDPDTAKYISTFLSGEATVADEKHSEMEAILVPQVNKDLNMSSTKRMLYTVDEIRRWGNDVCLLVLRGKYPIVLYKFPWSKHPLYGKIPPAKVEDLESVSKRIASRREDGAGTKDGDNMIHNRIEKLHPLMVTEKSSPAREEPTMEEIRETFNKNNGFSPLEILDIDPEEVKKTAIDAEYTEGEHDKKDSSSTNSNQNTEKKKAGDLRKRNKKYDNPMLKH